MAEKNHSHHTKGKIAAGVGLAALAAAAAGVVYLYGTESGKKKREEIKSWSLRMKADVMDKLEEMKDWSEGSYHDAINTVAQKYKMMKDIDTAEVTALVTSLKKHWKQIKSEVEGVKSVKPARKAARTKKTSQE